MIHVSKTLLAQESRLLPFYIESDTHGSLKPSISLPLTPLARTSLTRSCTRVPAFPTSLFAAVSNAASRASSVIPNAPCRYSARSGTLASGASGVPTNAASSSNASMCVSEVTSTVSALSRASGASVPPSFPKTESVNALKEESARKDDTGENVSEEEL